MQGNGLAPPSEKETSFSNQAKDIFTGVVTVEYETREGSGKLDKDFKYTQGKLVSRQSEKGLETCRNRKVWESESLGEVGGRNYRGMLLQQAVPENG